MRTCGKQILSGLAFAAGIMLLAPIAAQTGVVDMTGQVVDEAAGPVAGASVWVYTAGPRVGVGYL